MEKRWNVYHGNDYLGLKTAKEIREALRRGTLDAFDKVSLEGSNIREDLIDVDEIFKETSSVFQEDPNGTVVADRNPMQMAVGAQSPVTMDPVRSAPTAVAGPAQQSPNWRNEYSAMRQQGEASIQDSSKGPIKRYYIIDREKILGPLSAHEIQSLYNRGVLNKKVQVQKIGGKRTMSIAQFISSYAGDRMKELAEDGKIPQQIGVGSPSSKVLTELARMASSRRVAQQRKQRTFLMIAAIGLAIGVMGFLILQHNLQRNIAPPPSAETQTNREVEPSNRPRPRLIQKAPEPPRSQPAPKTPVLKAEPARSEAPISEEERSEPKRLDTPRSRPAPPIAVKPSRSEKPAKEPRVSSSKPSSTPLVPVPKPVPVAPKSPSVSTQAAPPVIALNPIPTNPPASASGQGPIAKALATAGRIQTIGPLTFNVNALEECLSKCNISMRDATGMNMKVVFFKNAYYEMLKNRSKGVTLTGSTKLDRGELTLIIQDVR